MKFVDLSTGEGIGANCHYLEIGPFKVVIDAGMNPREVGPESLPRLDRLPEHLDAVILTHCHLDHLGGLPVLMRRYPRTPVIMSLPSMMLARRMLHNSVNVMLRQREEKARPDLPVFTHGEVDRIGKQIVPMTYGLPRPIERVGEELEITLHPSGHVAGAVAVALRYKDLRVFHTGDVLFDKQRHLPGAQFPDRQADVLITETTRGRASRSLDRPREEEQRRLFARIEATIRGGGSVLVPVFALGRTQEMLCLLHAARLGRDLPKCPIFAVGLGMDLASVFDDITRKTGLLKFRNNVVKDLKLRTLASDLRPGRTPERGIYVLSSGMMVENTPSYALASTIVHDEASAVCFVGYCDPDTPGGKLQATPAGEPFLFDALDYLAPVRAHIERFDLSGHADREELVDYARTVKPSTVYLAHGDADAREWFNTTLKSELPDARIVNPVQGEIYAT